MPEVLYERVVEVDEQVILPLGDKPDRCALAYGKNKFRQFCGEGCGGFWRVCALHQANSCTPAQYEPKC